jgi:hypothetical protein
MKKNAQLFSVMFLLLVTPNYLALAECPPQWTTPPPPCEECSCPPGSGGTGGTGPGGVGNGFGAIRSGSGCSDCGGMPVWQVWEAQADYRLFDNPLKYRPAFGPVVSLDLVYQTWRPTDYGYYPRHDLNPVFGAQWHSLWGSELVIPSYYSAYWNNLGGRVIFGFNDPLLSACLKTQP